KADRQYFTTYQGRTYYFASSVERDKFLAKPDDFAPVLSGRDVVRVAQQKGPLIEGKRAYGLIGPDQHIYLFADENSLKQFESSPGAYAATARQAMKNSETGTVYR